MYPQIFVTLKIIFAYGGFFHITALTHAVDTARSAVVSWALLREQNRIQNRSASRGGANGANVFKADQKKMPKGSDAASGGQRPRVMKSANIGAQQSPMERDRDLEIDAGEGIGYVGRRRSSVYQADDGDYDSEPYVDENEASKETVAQQLPHEMV